MNVCNKVFRNLRSSLIIRCGMRYLLLRNETFNCKSCVKGFLAKRIVKISNVWFHFTHYIFYTFISVTIVVDFVLQCFLLYHLIRVEGNTIIKMHSQILADTLSKENVFGNTNNCINLCLIVYFVEHSFNSKLKCNFCNI